MLFRNFMLITTSIALMGIALLNVIEATRPSDGDFNVSERLKMWKLHDAKQACRANPKTCSLPEQLKVA